jgi:glycosyltransferase involved in cell wall biosynthesis
MDLTIIICTYNRAESLRLTLQSLREARIPAGVTWELLLVDNNSTDSTARVCEEFAGVLPIRYLREERQGLAFARNLGVKEAGGAIILFTDDDVDVSPEWIAELWSAANSHPETVFFGGRIEPRWESSPPQWMIRHSGDLLAGITIDFSLGDKEVAMEREKPFIGANMAFRREAMVEMGSFRDDLGMSGRSLGAHEETEYMRRLLRAGYQGLYVPGMLIHHRNPPERATERYVLRWFAGCGRSHVRSGNIQPAAATLFGAPRYLWRRLFLNAFRYIGSRWTARTDERWLLAAILMAETWGAISEFRRLVAESKCAGAAVVT